LLQYISDEDSPTEFADRGAQRDPYLLVIGATSSATASTAVKAVMLVIEKEVFPLSRTHLAAFDILFKVYYVLNIRIQSNLLHFLAAYIFQVENSARTPKLLVSLNQLPDL
jgi:hypothetical protein